MCKDRNFGVELVKLTVDEFVNNLIKIIPLSNFKFLRGIIEFIVKMKSILFWKENQ